MLVLSLGDITRGKSYADMINKAIGTKFQGLQRSFVELDKFNVPGVIAWFVFMDGTIHGYPDGWEWSNVLSADGKTISEYCVSMDKSKLIEKCGGDGYSPYRLCFQLDPYGNKNNHCCKFVGAFRLSRFLANDLSEMEFVKVCDDFRIGSIGDAPHALLNSKTDFISNDSRYHIPIAQMRFSNETYNFLQRGGIKFSGELLELGLRVSGKIIDEIREKLFEFFH